MRLTATAMAVPITIGILCAAGEVALHGFGLFVFRSPGTGATQQQGNNGARAPLRPPTSTRTGMALPARAPGPSITFVTTITTI